MCVWADVCCGEVLVFPPEVLLKAARRFCRIASSDSAILKGKLSKIDIAHLPDFSVC